jgi:3-hydroxybutyrate dehydrogenase
MRCVDTGQRGLPRPGADPAVEKQIADMATERKISRDDAALALLGEKQPPRTFVMPEQFLCSPAADQITGTAIAVDGAWTAQ